jgi:hypothetical protein
MKLEPHCLTENTSPSSFPSLREESRSLGRHREKCARWPVWRTPVSSCLNSRVRTECPNPACEPESKTVERSPMITTRSDCFFAIAVITSLVVSASPAFAQQKLGAPPGRGSFVRYCGACHGDDGKGDGPKASTLSPRPADLSAISRKHSREIESTLRSGPGPYSSKMAIALTVTDLERRRQTIRTSDGKGSCELARRIRRDVGVYGFLYCTSRLNDKIGLRDRQAL